MSKEKFNVVTPGWIREQMDAHHLTTGQLAEQLNVTPPKISHWLGGSPMSNPAKAAVFYLFESLK